MKYLHLALQRVDYILHICTEYLFSFYSDQDFLDKKFTGPDTSCQIHLETFAIKLTLQNVIWLVFSIFKFQN